MKKDNILNGRNEVLSDVAPETAAAAGRKIGSAEGQGAAVAEDCEDKKKESLRHLTGEQAFEL